MSVTRKRPAAVLEETNSANNYFDSSFPRSGKWTTDEEAFANKLIAEFEAGSLTDCVEGCTLRAYLAKRLNCAPMRISKKFAGQCIGKVKFCASISFIADVGAHVLLIIRYITAYIHEKRPQRRGGRTAEHFSGQCGDGQQTRNLHLRRLHLVRGHQQHEPHGRE